MTNSIDSQDRRRLLKLAAVSAATLWLPRAAWSQPRLSSYPFTLGVASGSPGVDSVVLWTRILGDGLAKAGAITVRWELAHDEGFARPVRSGQVQARPELAHAVHVELNGLDADRWYFYRFMLGDAVSPAGRTRTLPRPDASVLRLRLAYASCQRWEHGYFSAYRHMGEENLDAVLFLGDYIYEYPGAADPVREGPGEWPVTLDAYRRRYALYKSDADLQAMHAKVPWLVTWDDHEVQNDYAGLKAGEGGPAVADFALRRAAAYQAWYEHLPIRAAALTQGIDGLSGAEMRIYGRADFGRLASIYVLDGRQYRDPQACVAEGTLGSRSFDPAECPMWSSPERSMLGVRQEAWLAQQLARASGGWNVLGQQTLFGQMDRRNGPGELLWNDSWDGYAAARARLTDTLRGQRVANPVVFGGDIHQNWVGHVKADYRDPASPAVGVEFCGTSISSRTGGITQLPERLPENPHFVFAEAKHRGYGVAEFTPRRLFVALRGLDDVTRRDSGITTIARFSVEAGRSVVERD
jgi:alkaline phosphatase D